MTAMTDAELGEARRILSTKSLDGTVAFGDLWGLGLALLREVERLRSLASDERAAIRQLLKREADSFNALAAMFRGEPAKQDPRECLDHDVAGCFHCGKKDAETIRLIRETVEPIFRAAREVSKRDAENKAYDAIRAARISIDDTGKQSTLYLRPHVIGSDCDSVTAIDIVRSALRGGE